MYRLAAINRVHIVNGTPRRRYPLCQVNTNVVPSVKTTHMFIAPSSTTRYTLRNNMIILRINKPQKSTLGKPISEDVFVVPDKPQSTAGTAHAERVTLTDKILRNIVPLWLLMISAIFGTMMVCCILLAIILIIYIISDD